MCFCFHGEKCFIWTLEDVVCVILKDLCNEMGRVRLQTTREVFVIGLSCTVQLMELLPTIKFSSAQSSHKKAPNFRETWVWNVAKTKLEKLKMGALIVWVRSYVDLSAYIFIFSSSQHFDTEIFEEVHIRKKTV